MKFLFMTTLDWLSIEGTIKEPITLAGEVKLSNSIKLAKELVTYEMRRLGGTLETNYLLSGRPYVFALDEYPFKVSSETNDFDAIDKILVTVQMYLQVIWLLRDNSINSNTGIFQYPYPKRSSVSDRITVNTRNISFTNSQGRFETVRMTPDDLKSCQEVYASLYALDAKDGIYSIENQVERDFGRSSRVSKAMFLVQSARNAMFLPIKIALYCTCLETLVSTDSQELTHKVAERVAVLLGTTGDSCSEIYSDIKAAYSTRSRLVHGGKITADIDKYLAQAEKCDDYLRRCLRLILNDRSLHDTLESQEKTDQFFIKKLLGK